MSSIKWAVAVLLLTGQTVWAERTISIHSRYDSYDLELSGGGGTVNGKPADLSTFKELLPLLTDALANDCPPLKPPSDATVKTGDQTRYIYVKSGTVTDGKNCLNVSGEGLYYFPIHRDFLIGSKHDGVKVKSPLKIFRGGEKVLELKKTGKSWVPVGTDMLVNWDFIQRLEESLESYDVRFRALPELAQDKTKIILQLGNQSYELYKVTDVVWAMKKPGAHWLEASDNWSFWYDFDSGVLEDPLSSQIRLAEDTTKSKDDRLGVLEKLNTSWSRNLREMFHKFVLNPSEDPDIKAIAFRRLKTKPSMETAGVMAQYLKDGTDDDFKRTASQILKIQNPKGPLYSPHGSADEKAKAVEFWSHWWSQHQNSI